MKKKTNRAHAPTAAVPRKGRKAARKIARSSLFAAGLVFSQLGSPDLDPRFQLFDHSMVDRLQAPITRYHE